MSHNAADAERNEKIVEACRLFDPVRGEAMAHVLIDALDSALKEWMDRSQYDAAKQWLLTTAQKLVPSSNPSATLIDKMSYASGALKAIAAYSLQRASPEDRQQAERSAEVMSMRTGLGTAIGILLAAVTVIERTSAQLFANATNGGGG